MKKSFLLGLLLYTCIAVSQQDINNQWATQVNNAFKGLNKSKVPHGILLDYAMEFIDVPSYNGTINSSNYVDANILGNLYKTLFMGKVTTSLEHFPTLETVAKNWANKRQ